nr:hypothetical protein CFP56_56893 [Quercus suber]
MRNYPEKRLGPVGWSPDSDNSNSTSLMRMDLYRETNDTISSLVYRHQEWPSALCESVNKLKGVRQASSNSLREVIKNDTRPRLSRLLHDLRMQASYTETSIITALCNPHTPPAISTTRRSMCSQDPDLRNYPSHDLARRLMAFENSC